MKISNYIMHVYMDNKIYINNNNIGYLYPRLYISSTPNTFKHMQNFHIKHYIGSLIHYG